MCVEKCKRVQDPLQCSVPLVWISEYHKILLTFPQLHKLPVWNPLLARAAGKTRSEIESSFSWWAHARFCSTRIEPGSTRIHAACFSACWDGNSRKSKGFERSVVFEAGNNFPHLSDSHEEILRQKNCCPCSDIATQCSLKFLNYRKLCGPHAAVRILLILKWKSFHCILIVSEFIFLDTFLQTPQLYTR